MRVSTKLILSAAMTSLELIVKYNEPAIAGSFLFLAAPGRRNARSPMTPKAADRAPPEDPDLIPPRRPHPHRCYILRPISSSSRANCGSLRTLRGANRAKAWILEWDRVCWGFRPVAQASAPV